ncbi:hypothetical protein SO802_006167 [Lithocarpus litseifolius]|uniref:Reverse transcriptase zinc-binding domain-containing protein n=1 Tax=Lithocarpus litseifolius TaxID=425828 RepID=A0AAW2DLP8_9ROSI
MEVFSKLLQKGVEECTNFKHHSKCAALKLTHLCFAEDLTVFLGADVQSVQVVLEALDKFTRLLWLRENFTKSEIFIAATPPSLKKNETEFAPVQRRKLPVIYLGVLLISGKLTENDSKPLIDKITARTDSWAAKSLSYAGRLQLIQSVIFSLQGYWSGMFILPKKVIKAVEQKLGSVLWNGSNTSASRAKVSIVLDKDNWIWNPARSESLVNIQSKLSLVEIGNEDRPVYITEKTGKHSCVGPWNCVRKKCPKVKWWKMIWFPIAIPKHSFRGWLTVQNRLSTKDRMLQQCANLDAQCVQCDPS